MLLFEFKSIIEGLDNDTLYASSDIIMLAVDKQLVPKSDPQFYRKARIVLGRIIKDMGIKDGTIPFEGQAPIPAWTGCRWKETYQELIANGAEVNLS